MVVDSDIQQDVSNRGRQTDTRYTAERRYHFISKPNFPFWTRIETHPPLTNTHSRHMCCYAIWLAVLCFVYLCRYKALRSESARELVHMGIAEDSISPHKHNWCVINSDGQHRAYLIDVGQVSLASKSKQIKSKKQMALTR